MAAQDENTHWSGHSRQWEWIGPPLRPTPEDIDILQKRLEDSLANRSGTRVLMTGLTPEIQGIQQPVDGTLFAVDRSAAMIATLGLRSKGALALVTCGDWLAMPFASASFDVVVGDGCHNLLSGPERYRQLHGEFARLLRPGGRLLFRFFVRRAQPETVTDVVDELNAGRVGSFHAFKWRLLQALHDDREGVRLGEVWECWNGLGLSAVALAQRHGWHEREVLTIDAYRGQDVRYWLPDLDELKLLLAESFRVLSIDHGRYELAELCPIVLFEPR